MGLVCIPRAEYGARKYPYLYITHEMMTNYRHREVSLILRGDLGLGMNLPRLLQECTPRGYYYTKVCVRNDVKRAIIYCV